MSGTNGPASSPSATASNGSQASPGGGVQSAAGASNSSRARNSVSVTSSPSKRTFRRNGEAMPNAERASRMLSTNSASVRVHDGSAGGSPATTSSFDRV